MAPNQDTSSYNPFIKVSTDPGEEIVISGIAGRFPDSDNVQELCKNLINKVDLVTDADHRRWKLSHPEIPQRTGKINKIAKFDSDFFSIPPQEVDAMDPMGRMLLEHTYEAVLDAGVNPKHLKGRNTGVFIGACFSESEMEFIYEKTEAQGFGIPGCSRATLANRVSHVLGITGPSYAVDSACSSSLFAMEQGYRAIRTGVCDDALVGGVNLCLHPNLSLQFSRLGIVSPDGRSKSFDNKANGYARGETVSVIYLQKAKNAKRIYATVVHAKTNCDGFKEEGITFPSTMKQSILLKEIYEECKISPFCLSFMEAHGTGTWVGDPEELNAIDAVFCTGRKEPLKIGSVKSNLGHAEGASGMCQIAKVVIACETGLIPPNLHYEQPREGVKGLFEGRLQVVTKPTPWRGGYIGVSSFGFGGANAHILLKSNPKEKINGGAPRDDLPRLVVTSGRTEEAVNTILNDIDSRPIDVEYIRLLHDLHVENIDGHRYRGYTVLGASKSHNKLRDIQRYSETKRPVWFVFSGIGSQWPEMGIDLLRFPVFANIIKKCDAVLNPRAVHLYDILTTSNKSYFDITLKSSIGIVAVQIGLVELLKSLGIVPDGIIGDSIGELGCAYADGSLTAEQTILAAYFIGLASQDNHHINGSAKKAELNGAVPKDNRYIADTESKLFACLKKIIPEPKARSFKWLSASVPKSQWNSSQAKFASADYLTNTVYSTSFFEETCSFIPKDAVVIEIAPHGIVQSLLKKYSGPKVTYVALSERDHKNNVEVFLQGIGNLYEIGLQPTMWKLYPEVSFPVSRGTPMLSPLIKWDHSEDRHVISFNLQTKLETTERIFKLTLAEEEYEFMSGHVIDGRNLLPATGYLTLVWQTLGMMRGEMFTEVPVVFEDVKFMRATTLSKNAMDITIVIQKGSGNFELIEGGTAVVTGCIRYEPHPEKHVINIPIASEDEPEEMSTKDVYKELKLRGYHYGGLFKNIKSSTTTGSKGTIHWVNNWVAFMDKMLQMKILTYDTRSLYVPTAMRKVVIDPQKHFRLFCQMPEDKKEFKVYNNEEFNIIECGGVQIRGMDANSIARRKPAGQPVIQKYDFVAYRDRVEISLKEALHLASSICLENQPGFTIKVFEALEVGEKYPVEELLSLFVSEALGNLPMIQADVNIVTSENPFAEDELPKHINLIEPKKLSKDTEALIVAGRGLFTADKSATLDHLLIALKRGGFVITIESMPPEKLAECAHKNKLKIIFERIISNTTFLLLQKIEKIADESIVIQVKNEELSWLETVKTTLKGQVERKVTQSLRIILVSDKNYENGLLGFVNCLRREPDGNSIRGILIQDENAPDFDMSIPLYAEQLNLDLAINVLRPNGRWGSYKHYYLPPLELRPTHHAWANQLVKGDLSSFQWLEGPIKSDCQDPKLVNVVYSSINFKDIMLATGRLPPDIFCKTRDQLECVLGFEYAGIAKDDRRVMGLLTSRVITNLLISDAALMWAVPNSWTLEEAATVPCVYATCYYALHFSGKMKKGDKVLIHAGSGGVGQAAITLALWTACEVFVTVGTEEKRNFIKQKFPQIDDDHIGNSRDTSFEQLIMKETKGRGVDIVLNSLAEDKLQASIRCLAEGGRFLEIGKFDMANNSRLGMSAFLKEISFHAILLDKLFEAPEDYKWELNRVMQKGIDEGAVKPLNATVFTRDQIEAAFRYMAGGKHIGKVVLKIQDENKLGEPIPALPHTYCQEDCSYLILGGLGGFGLELADFLILRGARNIVLTSRSGIKNGYQHMRTKLWKSYGINVTIIAGKDAAELKDCEEILTTASQQGPIDGIYNLAMVLKDDLLEKQTVESFVEPFKAKAWGTKNLDKLSRQMCPNLRHFVVFSSIACGLGNPEQTNYGMTNSVMERICEKRTAEGLPALAVQWGVVGDVGIVADMIDDNRELSIGGTVEQKITSCLHVLDGFLNQKSPIVSSMVVAEKRSGSSGSLNVVDTVLGIMGLKDVKSVGLFTPLAELGMDSMMGVEIKQTLERDFELFLTPQDIRGLNFAKLIEMTSKDGSNKNMDQNEEKEKTYAGMAILWRLMAPESTFGQILLEMSTKAESQKDEIFLIPGMEGSAAAFKNIAPELKLPAVCLQLDNSDVDYHSIEEIAENTLPYLLERLGDRKKFTIVGYSYGGLISIEVARKAEAMGLFPKLIFIDAAPDYVKGLKMQQLESTSREQLETLVLVGFADVVAPQRSAELLIELKKCKTWEEKLKLFADRSPPDALNLPLYQRNCILSCMCNRLITLDNYDISNLSPIKSPIILLKPTTGACKEVSDDYGLGKVTEKKVKVYTFKGDHVTILDNLRVADVINTELGCGGGIHR